MDISVVIPVYNEEKNLSLLHEQISSAFLGLGKDYELVFVDDGSSDKSLEELKEIRSKDSRVRIISFDRNYGQTCAFDAGFKAAKGEFVLTMDADLTYDIRDCLRILDALSDSDAVIGVRSNRKAVDGMIKFISSKIANLARNAVLKEDFKDAGCALRGFRSIALKDLLLYRGTQVFIISLLHMQGYKIKEIGVKCYPRKYGKSKYNIRNRILKELFALFAVWYMKFRRLHYNISYSC